MRTTLLTLSPAALLLLASAGTAFAADSGRNAMITIEASIVTATCDVSVTDRLNLNNHTAAVFTAANTFIDTTAQNFDVRLMNCGTPSAEDDTASLRISGSTLSGGSNNIFNSDNSSSVGVMIKHEGTILQSGDSILVGTAGSTPAPGDFEKSISLSAALATTNISAIENTTISAPITFSFVYN
ncbi:P pilus assembly protein, pilin FimA [Yersinia frederiksenii]|uniref:P pilus assembly protein, pilin FimA n=2 Tax=Yersinia frederiksenii TaxID=29484 RepID=A0A380PZE5_YERFR|nr:fimbrial protein [Yersinia frederiksenii]ATM96766.1 type 1 fimbrial protein [Yersinia frederiksenii]KGA45394.1 fimbrial family protein [Yersinia frederiksenii ATCC 33641]MDN0120339.1 fimbrial protein [Yersinia frederiksenii]SUP78871.1 P pilus assembly protein, pilin FimA [Yersinia frederiksenii]